MKKFNKTTLLVAPWITLIIAIIIWPILLRFTSSDIVGNISNFAFGALVLLSLIAIPVTTVIFVILVIREKKAVEPTDQ